jgi:hypothetical protein
MAWTRKNVVDLLTHSNNKLRCKAVRRAIVRLHSFQTPGEQQARQTVLRNGVGFGAFHARKGSQLAELVQKGAYLRGCCFSQDWLQEWLDRGMRRAKPGEPKCRAEYTRSWNSPLAKAQRIALRHAGQLVVWANSQS